MGWGRHLISRVLASSIYSPLSPLLRNLATGVHTENSKQPERQLFLTSQLPHGCRPTSQSISETPDITDGSTTTAPLTPGYLHTTAHPVSTHHANHFYETSECACMHSLRMDFFTLECARSSTRRVIWFYIRISRSVWIAVCTVWLAAGMLFIIQYRWLSDEAKGRGSSWRGVHGVKVDFAVHLQAGNVFSPYIINVK